MEVTGSRPKEFRDVVMKSKSTTSGLPCSAVEMAQNSLGPEKRKCECIVTDYEVDYRAAAVCQTGQAVELLPPVSVIMPCLNEAETLRTCIQKAAVALARLSIESEIVIADNGSSDGSQAIAVSMGARVVEVSERGYGNALRGGILAARCEYVVFADADDSYDFGDIPRFVKELDKGFDLVMGNRFRGQIKAGAMPWQHQYFGNPVLSWIGRLFFRSPVGDFHCGMRGLRRTAFQIMDMRTTGMEFASEMVIKATL